METIPPTPLNAALWEQAFDYAYYRQMIADLLAQNRTTGENQSESLVGYARLNEKRMQRWDKTAEVSAEVRESIALIREPTHWLIITEGWCGDAAQNIPIIVKMAALNPNITLRFLLRDEHPALMNAYLTNGSRSIPKLIAVHADDFSPMFIWGSRPRAIQDWVVANKDLMSHDELAEFVHKWYAQDKTYSIQREIAALVREAYAQ